MKSSVYVSSERIEVIGYTGTGGNVAVKGYITAPLPEGTMINGKIIDSAPLTEALQALRAKSPGLFKEPSLIVDGSSILTRRDTSPKLSAKHLEQFVRDGFADTADNPEDLACAFQKLETAKNGCTTFFACAADKTQVESYISAFRHAGIKLQAIRIGPEALMNFVAERPEMLMHTFVLNVIDGVMMLSIVVDSGINVFMSRTRLYSENYEQMIQRVLENLSGLLQFNRSQKFNDITHSYYIGLKQEDLQLMEQISPYPDIKLDIPHLFRGVKGGEELPPTAHFAFLNTKLGKDSIDLMQGLKALAQRKRRQKPKRLWIPLVSMIVLLLGGLSGLMVYRSAQTSAEIAAIAQELENPATVAKLEELQGLTDETSGIGQYIGQLEDKEARDAEKAVITLRVLDLIESPLQGIITISQFSFDESQNMVSISGNSTTDTGTAEYVEALKLSELVEDVQHTGYGPAGDGYSFSLNIKLAAAGGIAP